MKTWRDTCIDFFTDETVKKDVHELIKPLFHMIYNEIYVYVWIIAFYHFFIICMILSMFWILWKLMKKQEWKQNILAQMAFTPPRINI